MDIRQYISSGVLESYVLGAVNHQEKKEVECLSNIYPEIKEELDELSSAVEEFISYEKIQPPVKVREAIFNDLYKLEQQHKLEAKVLAMVNEPEAPKQHPFIYWMAAASVILIISGYYFFNSKIEQRDKQLSVLGSEVRNLKNESSASLQKQNNLQQQLSILKNPDNQLLALKGTAQHPNASAMICWNRSNKEVYLCSQNMPVQDISKQYQLWAIIDGKPVNMGILDPDLLLNGFIKAGIIQNAQAFAITLENKGGSPSPHLEQLYVIGNV